MLLRMSELFEIAFMFLGINYICSKRYIFRFYDLVFSVGILIILDLVNAGHIDKIYIGLGYIALVIYVLAKFRPKLRILFVGITVFFVYMVVSEQMLSIPACLTTETFQEELAVLTAVYLIAVMKFSDVLRGTDYLLFGLWAILFCIQMIMWQKRKSDAYIHNKEQELERTYGGSYQELLQDVRRKQHEFDNHLIALSGIYKTVSSAEALIREQKMYCEQLGRDNRYNKLLAVPSPVLAGFLYSKLTRAEERGCDPAYRIEIPSINNMPLPEYRVIEILGILLDNAIEALEKQDTRKLYAEISEDPEYMRILVKNNSDYIRQNDIRCFVRAGYSTKGKDRGLGLTTVAELAKKYDGILRIFNDEDNQLNWLVTEVVIPVRRKGRNQA